jgi:OHCU decarboxylase
MQAALPDGRASDTSQMTLEKINALPACEAEAEFLKCCGSTHWSRAMAEARPFVNQEALFAKADEVSLSLTDEDWLEAFRAHPKIGEKKAAAAQSPQEKNWSAEEQSGVAAASASTVAQIAEGNREYEARFGFIFIVCASGKSSGEMLSILNQRLPNDPATELKVAAQEQQQITRLRLEKLLNQ